MRSASFSESFYLDCGSVISAADISKKEAAFRRILHTLMRAQKMDPGLLCRVRSWSENEVELFISTPLGVLVEQRLSATLCSSASSPTVSVPLLIEELAALLQRFPVMVEERYEDVVKEREEIHIPLTAVPDLLWSGSIPPSQGYEPIDSIPASSLRKLYKDIEQEHSAESGPLGIAPSLLEQELITVEHGKERYTIQGKTVITMNVLGFLREPPHKLQSYDYLKLSAHHSWIRMDALYGSCYVPRAGSLTRVPRS